MMYLPNDNNRPAYIKYKLKVLDDMRIPHPSKEQIEKCYDKKIGAISIDNFFRSYILRQLRDW